MTLHTGRLMALICSAVILFLTSCEDGDSLHALPDEGKGKVMLSLYSDIEIKSPQAISEVDDYNFRFVGVGEYGTSQYYRYGDVSWPMDWYFGIFRLQAESCTADEAESGYGKLRYEGIGQPFSVINDQTATASVVCSVANFRVVANFNDKMFMSYKDFKLVVESVLMPVYEEDEDGNQILVRDEQQLRSLDFTTINKTGYYNLHNDPLMLRYVLYVMVDGADEFIEQQRGFFKESGSSEPAEINAGDDITFNVNYVGDVQPSAGIKFIINGERKPVSNGIEIGDYTQGAATEDK